MWNFKLIKEANVIYSIIFPNSVFVKLQLKWIVVACTFSSMQWKWNLIWHAQKSNKLAVSEVWWNLEDGIQHQQLQRTSIFYCCYFILLFCSRFMYFSFFLDERFLHPVLEFQALAAFCKPSLVKFFSWLTLTVVKVSRTALANRHYYSAQF